jgi:HEPN domain-containing protein
MTPPLLRAEEVREWLRLAARDLRMAELALGDVVPLIAEALYHAQQAAEQALKGFLVWRGIKYPLTHDIRKLLDLCAPLDSTLDGALTAAVDLTQFAVRFRYPGEEQPTPEEARSWLDLARRTYEEVRLRLPVDAKD